MRPLLVAILLAAAALPRPVSAQSAATPHVAVLRADAPRRLEWTVRVPANPERVWAAFTTADGLSTWLAPSARIELRPGGEWTALFPGGPPGGGTILAYGERSYLALAAMAPDRFPTVRRERTFALFTFAPDPPSGTVVRLVQTGWKEGPEWSDAYETLAAGNAQLMEFLYRRFAEGPIRWRP